MLVNKKITEYPAAASLVSTDLIPVVVNPATVPVTKKALISVFIALLDTLYVKLTGSLADIANHSHTVLTSIGTNTHAQIDTALGTTIPATYTPNNGWIAAGTMTYASATTITVASGAASIYTKGDRLKLTQTTVKYFYIVSVADTLLTITGGSSYTLTNAAISANFYSKVLSPVGFPSTHLFTTTVTGFSADPNLNCQFYIAGGLLTLIVADYANGTSNDTTFTMTAPVLIVAYVLGYASIVDNGVSKNGSYQANYQSTISFYNTAFAAFTASGAKGASAIIQYPI